MVPGFEPTTLEHESSPITIRPGMRFFKYLAIHLRLLSRGRFKPCLWQSNDYMFKTCILLAEVRVHKYL